MLPRKKLQVFVSSTYTDLKEERQAAVEAILSAGHIPAGMELFSAGDKSQMEAIKRWIDESDVFLLILGGRYGSLEPASNKSYIELEYEYAQEQRKAFFAVVIDKGHLEEKVKQYGSSMLETENPQRLKDFRATVQTKLVRFFSDPRDIKLAIHETLSDFSRRDELVGWIPGDQSVNSGAVAEEIARLGKENAMLRERLCVTTLSDVSFSSSWSSPDGTKAAMMKTKEIPPGGVHTVLVYDDSGKIVTQFDPGFGIGIPIFAWSQDDSKLLVYWPQNGRIVAFDVAGQKPLGDHLIKGGGVVDFSQDGKSVIIKKPEGLTEVWPLP